MTKVRRASLVLVAIATVLYGAVVSAQTAKPTPKPPTTRPEFPPFSVVGKGYTKVAPTGGKSELFTLWRRDKDGQMLAELPSGYTSKRFFIAVTVQSGETYAGLQAGDFYITFRRYGKNLAIVQPNVSYRSTGEKESKDSVKRIFTDRVMLSVPIVTMSPTGKPMIDLDALLVGRSSSFFRGSRVTDPRLIKIVTAKSFPKNNEVAFEVVASGGRLKTLHYSISEIPSSTGYRPRKADERVGFFTTTYRDLGKYKDDETTVRLINRWHLEKADPSLKLSPPKQPIVFYIEHTTPKRYRHWVKKGILMWNKAFEKVGLRDAIVVYQQDSNPSIFPNHMEKDPEDVRYNFVRWLNNDIGTAIGPSRVHPLTGQILDADIILTDGWIRYYENQFNEVMPKVAMEGFGPETLDWLNRHPNWDPRVLFAAPSDRHRLIAQRAQMGMLPHGGHPIANVKTPTLGDDEFDGLIGVHSQRNGLCLAADGKALDLEVLRATLSMLAAADEDDDEDDEDDDKDKKKDDDKDDDKKKDDDDKDDDGDKEDDDQDGDKKDKEDADKKDDDKKDDKKKADKKPAKKKPEEQKLDGVPESFIGPLITELVAHEVGHTLGLRHNFKASSIYSLNEIAERKTNGGPLAGSVMDYLPINMRMKDGEIQGEHTMTDIGAYDMWAIEYGYTFSKDLKSVLQRVADPTLVYGTDEDAYGPDPRARRYDFSKDPLDYAKDQMKLAKYHRKNLLDKFVKDGDSWSKARRGYQLSLFLQTRSLSMMANWIGGTFVNRDKKGDKNGREPLEVVPVERQRDALAWTLEHAFKDEAFGLNPELIRHLTVDQWLDGGFFFISNPDFPVHDQVLGIQTSTLTMLMNPTTLRLVYDNELRTPSDEDILTLPELLGSISDAIWSEVSEGPSDRTTARKPWLSSLRRNLQREHLERLIDLSLPSAGFAAAYKPISNLAVHRLRKIDRQIKKVLAKYEDKLDPYSLSHLEEAHVRIEKALDADYIYNADDIGGFGGGGYYYFYQGNKQKPE